MLIDEIVSKCDKRYSNLADCQCEDCPCETECSHDCKECLENVHFPDRTTIRREYDCVNMADCYYCKYSYRYASELIYGLRQFRDIKNRDILKVMSVGCGPCTELAAIDYMLSKGEIHYNKLEFVGIDPLKNVWGNIWDDIKDYLADDDIEFLDRDILDIINIITENNWVPDLIIFQYVFSDMNKKNSRVKIERFIDTLADFLNEHTEKAVYVIANDINLSVMYSGGREFFDVLGKKIGSEFFFPYHFDNLNRENHYHYGTEYEENSIFFDIPRSVNQKYIPFDSCASAQVLIIKKKEEG